MIKPAYVISMNDAFSSGGMVCLLFNRKGELEMNIGEGPKKESRPLIDRLSRFLISLDYFTSKLTFSVTR